MGRATGKEGAMRESRTAQMDRFTMSINLIYICFLSFTLSSFRTRLSAAGADLLWIVSDRSVSCQGRMKRVCLLRQMQPDEVHLPDLLLVTQTTAQTLTHNRCSPAGYCLYEKHLYHSAFLYWLLCFNKFCPPSSDCVFHITAITL